MGRKPRYGASFRPINIGGGADRARIRDGAGAGAGGGGPGVGARLGGRLGGAAVRPPPLYPGAERTLLHLAATAPATASPPAKAGKAATTPGPPPPPGAPGPWRRSHEPKAGGRGPRTNLQLFVREGSPPAGPAARTLVSPTCAAPPPPPGTSPSGSAPTPASRPRPRRCSGRAPSPSSRCANSGPDASWRALQGRASGAASCGRRGAVPRPRRRRRSSPPPPALRRAGARSARRSPGRRSRGSATRRSRSRRGRRGRGRARGRPARAIAAIREGVSRAQCEGSRRRSISSCQAAPRRRRR